MSMPTNISKPSADVLLQIARKEVAGEVLDADQQVVKDQVLRNPDIAFDYADALEKARIEADVELAEVAAS